jgi:hypothetical protein
MEFFVTFFQSDEQIRRAAHRLRIKRRAARDLLCEIIYDVKKLEWQFIWMVTLARALAPHLFPQLCEAPPARNPWCIPPVVARSLRCSFWQIRLTCICHFLKV